MQNMNSRLGHREEFAVAGRCGFDYNTVSGGVVPKQGEYVEFGKQSAAAAHLMGTSANRFERVSVCVDTG